MDVGEMFSQSTHNSGTLVNYPKHPIQLKLDLPEIELLISFLAQNYHYESDDSKLLNVWKEIHHQTYS